MERQTSQAIYATGLWSAVLAAFFAIAYDIGQLAEWVGLMGSGGPMACRQPHGAVRALEQRAGDLAHSSGNRLALLFSARSSWKKRPRNAADVGKQRAMSKHHAQRARLDAAFEYPSERPGGIVYQISNSSVWPPRPETRAGCRVRASFTQFPGEATMSLAATLIQAVPDSTCRCCLLDGIRRSSPEQSATRSGRRDSLAGTLRAAF